jgi:peptidoglycan/xylan/chitin deacetylase (PgdA/CDA1 family)
MRPARIVFALLGCGLAISIAEARPVQTTPRVRAHAKPIVRHHIPLAITVDDLPGGGPEVGEFTHVRIVQDIVATLQAHHVLHPTGFVVGAMLEDRPERQSALDAWVNAGFEVGNHTYTHSSIAEIGLEAYVEDIKRNRAIVDVLEERSGQRHHYFRYPYLEEGRTEQERRTLTRFLASEHYTVARVSLDFSDWAWAGAYARCMQRGDNKEALRLLQQSYLDNAMAYLVWSVAAGHSVVGHAVPQVLLLHANVATALNLDALLTAYENTGVRYVSLQDALADPIYTTSYEISGGTVFGQMSNLRGRPHPPYLVRPLPLLDLACTTSPDPDPDE